MSSPQRGRRPNGHVGDLVIAKDSRFATKDSRQEHLGMTLLSIDFRQNFSGMTILLIVKLYNAPKTYIPRMVT